LISIYVDDGCLNAKKKEQFHEDFFFRNFSVAGTILSIFNYYHEPNIVSF